MVYAVCVDPDKSGHGVGSLLRTFDQLFGVTSVYNVLPLHNFFTFIMYKIQVCVQDAFMEYRNKIL